MSKPSFMSDAKRERNTSAIPYTFTVLIVNMETSVFYLNQNQENTSHFLSFKARSLQGLVGKYLHFKIFAEYKPSKEISSLW